MVGMAGKMPLQVGKGGAAATVEGAKRKTSACPGTLRHRVVRIPLGKRVATANAPHSQPSAFERAIFFIGLPSVFRAGGDVVAARAVPGAEGALIPGDQLQ